MRYNGCVRGAVAARRATVVRAIEKSRWQELKIRQWSAGDFSTKNVYRELSSDSRNICNKCKEKQFMKNPAPLVKLLILHRTGIQTSFHELRHLLAIAESHFLGDTHDC